MKKYIEKAFLAVFVVALGMVLALCYLGKYYHISTLSYVIATILILGLFYSCALALHKLEKVLNLSSKRGVKCILLIWGIMLLVLGNYIKGEPSNDFKSIYETVSAFVAA